MKKCLVVLGMHRSGTSALTGVLNIMGVNLGDELLPPAEKINPKGFFENQKILNINEIILQRLGSSWDDLFFYYNDNWQQKSELKECQEDALFFIDSEFKNVSLFAIKDPRINRLLPFWQNIFQKLEIEPVYVISIRHPLEVAYSLKVRDNFSLEKSCLLWQSHMLEAELYTRNSLRCFVTYDNLLSNPLEVLDKISQSLDFSFPNKVGDSINIKIEEFLEKGLKNHSIDTLKINEAVIENIFDYYNILLKIDDDKNNENILIRKIDKIRGEFVKLNNFFYNRNILELKINKEGLEKDNSFLHNEVRVKSDEIRLKGDELRSKSEEFKVKDEELKVKDEELKVKD